MQTPATTARLDAVDPITIKCGRPDGRLRRIAPSLPRNLGTFEGERKQNCRGYDENYSVAKAMLSLASVAACLFVAAMLLGAA